MTTPTFGWRVWGLVVRGGHPFLCSPLAGDDSIARTAHYNPPRYLGASGVYAMPTEDDLYDSNLLPAAAMTRVELHGDIRRGTVMVNEVYADAVTMVSPASVSPMHERHIPSLARRYGLDFQVDPSLDTDRMATAVDMLNAALLQLSQPIRRQTAGLLLMDKQHTHTVLQLRSFAVDHPGTWALVGGGAEPGESPVEAALREAWEEARISPQEVQVLGTWKRPRGRKGYVYVIGQSTEPRPDDPIIPHSCNLEADGAAWVSLDRVSGLPLHPDLAKDWQALLASVEADHVAH